MREASTSAAADYGYTESESQPPNKLSGHDQRRITLPDNVTAAWEALCGSGKCHPEGDTQTVWHTNSFNFSLLNLNVKLYGHSTWLLPGQTQRNTSSFPFWFEEENYRIIFLHTQASVTSKEQVIGPNICNPFLCVYKFVFIILLLVEVPSETKKVTLKQH